MNDSDRRELDRLKYQLGSVRHELDRLWTQVQEFEARLGGVPGAPESPVPLAPAPSTAHPPPRSLKPPPIPAPLASLESPAVALPPASVAIPVMPAAIVTAATPEEAPAQSAAISPPPPLPAPVHGDSLEMKVGSYWLVRVGIVMLLTGMVFFGMYAYEHVIVQMGPAGRVALLYLASFTLLGLGAWLYRRQETLRNYGQILFGGGLAAVYFTTYAAHHVENLRIIVSPVVDGCLLLGWTGCMVWLADRRRLQLLSLFAFGLAYYTAAITNVGWFTLYSNLLLAAGSLALFLRHRWTPLALLSLLGTYAGYAVWWIHRGPDWTWTSGNLLWARLLLAAYWALFTAGGFLARSETGNARALFLTFNNIAAFSLYTAALFQLQLPGFWLFALGGGALLLVLAVAADRILRGVAWVREAYALQGITLVTTGCIAKFSGLTLALILGVESTLLMLLAGLPGVRGVRWVALCVAAIATMSGLSRFQQFHRPDLVLAVGVGLLFLFNAGWSRRGTSADAASRAQPAAIAFTFLALALWLAAAWNNSTRAAYPVVLMAMAIVLTLSVHALRIPEFPLVSQGFVLFAQAGWMVQAINVAATAPPFWQPAFLVISSVGLSHWWQRQRLVELEHTAATIFQSLYALAAVAMLHQWLQPLSVPATWLMLASALGVLFTVYGAVTRSIPLAAAAQVFLIGAAWHFAHQLLDGHPPVIPTLTPIGAFLLLGGIAARLVRRLPAGEVDTAEPARQVARVYRWSGMFLAVLWIFEYVPARNQMPVLALFGAALFAAAGWWRNRETLVASLGFTALGATAFWLRQAEDPATGYVPHLLAFGLLLAQQRATRRWPDRFPGELHVPFILAGGLGIWRWTSLVVRTGAEGFFLTATWAGLAFLFLLAGLLLRERAHRWLAFGILAAALGRVLLLDVWKLDTLYRIVSFVALGIVLLALGFIYNRYQEKIRTWL